MAKLIIARHAESILNKSNIFSGLIDTPLADHGIQQSKELGMALKNENIDIAYVSDLMRAKETAAIALMEYYKANPKKAPVFSGGACINDPQNCLPIMVDARLNERNYGILEGKAKDDMIAQYGEKRVFMWRRGFHSHPPGGESLFDLYNKAKSIYMEIIIPLLAQGKSVFIVAHQNTLRAFCMMIEAVEIKDMPFIEFNNCEYIIYDYKKEGRLTRLPLDPF